ncbi:hypothetical protein B0J13DRAFT_278744 [Dactylonectria estremocensis]|uniref:Uncharacterized protein n=1 Tax=Dactylonectria estremocensis TaxID=1079267 RepID=A0A9P9F175_9HYPO|nr:hypothetical protein B0J13DRAFT_278744 [Dactylonectria estremocensis]
MRRAQSFSSPSLDPIQWGSYLNKIDRKSLQDRFIPPPSNSKMRTRSPGTCPDGARLVSSRALRTSFMPRVSRFFSMCIHIYLYVFLGDTRSHSQNHLGTQKGCQVVAECRRCRAWLSVVTTAGERKHLPLLWDRAYGRVRLGVISWARVCHCYRLQRRR